MRTRQANEDVFKNLLIVGSFALVAMVASAAKEIVIAQEFGVSAVVDAYQFSINIAQWPVLLLSTVFSFALVPLVAQLDKSAVFELRAKSSAAMVLIVPALCLLVYFGLTLIGRGDLVSIEPELATQIVSMILPITAGIVFSTTALYLGAWIIALGRQSNTLFQAIPSATIAVVLLIQASASTLLWGTVLGFALFSLSALAYLVRLAGPLAFDFQLGSANLRTLFLGMSTLLIGQFLISLVTIVDQFFALTMDAGTLASLAYATRILGIGMSIASLTVTRGMLPVFSREYLKNSAHTRIVYSWSAAAFGMGCLVAAALFVGSETLVAIIFERGAFTEVDTKRVAHLLDYAALQLPFFFASLVFACGLLSSQRHRTVATIGAIAGISKVLLAYLLVPAFGIEGLLMATAAVYLISMVGGCVATLKQRPPAELSSQSPRI